MLTADWNFLVVTLGMPAAENNKTGCGLIKFDVNIFVSILGNTRIYINIFLV